MSEFSLLSRQEKKVLASLATGGLYKEVAADCGISINTVKKHLKNIYRKLQVNKRTLAIQKFREFEKAGLVSNANSQPINLIA